MLREKLTSFFSYSGLGKSFRRALVSTLSVAFSASQTTKPATKTYDKQYDLAVIGGGSGGLATAFEANKHGLSVIVIDFVTQTSHKSKWGIGGTCVNVGCIPKKLMHQAAKSHQQIVNSAEYGWQLPQDINDRSKHEELTKRFNWMKLKNRVQGYIKSINFGYIANINRVDQMDYLNCLATFKDKDTVICSKDPKIIYQYLKTGALPQNNTHNAHYYEVKAKNFLIATGTRPSLLPIEGAEHAITSDDIFMKKTPPGKTLVVGGGYVAVQIAGFLNGMGYNVSLMTRGDYLRAFDRDMVNFLLSDLKSRKVNLVETSLPIKIQKRQDGKLNVIVKNVKTNEVSPPEEFDTVLFAVGRTATTQTLGLRKIGVNLAKSLKIKTTQEEVEKTNFDNIYAIGDVVEGLPQLTSTATKMGWHLGRRIVQRLGKKTFKNHQLSVGLQNYPTTIFTPLQYSCSGLSEQQAIKKYGRDDISVYHTLFTPLQENILEKYNEEGESQKTNAYAKAVVQKSNNKVLGLHYAGPHAGEVMQGFAVAMRIGLTKQQLDSTIGIHPTSAQQLTNMDVTKQSGEDYMKTSC